jgi:hypothetical protein
MTKQSSFVVAIFSMLAAACGGGPTTVDAAGTDAASVDSGASTADAGSVGSCDLRSGAGYCQEYFFSPASLDVYHTNCDTSGGTWADAACPREMAIGGCGRTEAGFGDAANWFYAGGPYADATAVMMVCAGDPAAHFIAP